MKAILAWGETGVKGLSPIAGIYPTVVNAFERDGEIVMDLVGYDDPGVIAQPVLQAVKLFEETADRLDGDASAGASRWRSSSWSA